VNIKLIQISVLSGGIISTKNSIPESIKNFIIIENNQFVQLWTAFKHDFVIDTILKTQISFNIVFIQEPLWSFIYLLFSSKNCEEKELVGVSNHPNWIMFSRNLLNINDSPRVITYINISFISHYKKIFLIIGTFLVFLFSIVVWYIF